jgi:hypothetical protein
MADFFSPKSQVLFDDILWLPQAGARTGPTGRPPNAYAILVRDGSVLVDAAFSWNVPGIAEVADMGKAPAALVLTSAHVVEQADALEEIHRSYGCPVYLHPSDQTRPEAANAGVPFEDVGHEPLLTKAGVDVIPMQHHSPGTIMLHMEEHRGTLFAGISAIAPGPLQEAEPPRLERPDVGQEADADFRAQWEVLCAQRKYSNILPLYGTPYTDRTDTHQIMRKLWDGMPLDMREVRDEAAARERAEGVHV